jgi:hypothetical protein
MCRSKPSYVEITCVEARMIRQGLRQQAYRDRECWTCLAPLRDRTSTYCSQACAVEMQDPGDVDLPARVVALVIRLPQLVSIVYREARRVAAVA